MSEEVQPEETGIPPESTATVQPIPPACERLAHAPNILDHLISDLNVSGEDRVAKLTYLALTSRFLDRPVSLAVKGPSSGGKSYTTEQVLRFFPVSAYYALTAMSEKVLAYTDANLKHRMIVIFEAAGMGQTASYLMRSLLSEGRLIYEVVEKTDKGLKSRCIEKEGPTGLLVTTTAASLHPENETRMLSVNVNDTPEQTRAVFHALVDEPLDPIDLAQWHALQDWLAVADHEVDIPYAKRLAALVSNAAVRMRRDFRTLLSLIKAHAILHQATRERDSKGRIIATLGDYAVVRSLVSDLMAEGIGVSVAATVRETVSAVQSLIEAKEQICSPDVTGADVARYLKLDKGTVSRRLRDAVKAGYLQNEEDRRGRPMRLSIGEPMPEDLEVLPTVERLRGCSENGEVHTSTFSGTGASPASSDGELSDVEDEDGVLVQ